MKVGWSLLAVLQAAAAASSAWDALRRWDVCSSSCGECGISVEREWHRAGAETYGLVARVDHTGGGSSRLYLKACIALGDLSGVGSIVSQWKARRVLLRDNGVAVPRLYATHQGTLYEEYIAHDLRDRLHCAPTDDLTLFRALGSTIGTLMRLGFASIFVHDWRSRGQDIVLVDFGQDLGDPGTVSVGNVAVLEDVLAHLDRLGIVWTRDRLRAISENLETALGSCPPPSRA